MTIKLIPSVVVALMLAPAALMAAPSKDNDLATNDAAVARRTDIAENGVLASEVTAADDGDDAALAASAVSDGPALSSRSGGRERRLRDHDIDVSLFWSSNSDMDLRVKAPRGGCDIWYSNPECDDAFLVEDIVPYDCDYGETDENEERIVWPRTTAPKGKYKVTVTHFGGSCGPATAMVRVDAKSRGRRVARKRFTIQRGESKSFKFKRRD